MINLTNTDFKMYHFLGDSIIFLISL